MVHTYLYIQSLLSKSFYYNNGLLLRVYKFTQVLCSVSISLYFVRFTAGSLFYWKVMNYSNSIWFLYDRRLTTYQTINTI